MRRKSALLTSIILTVLIVIIGIRLGSSSNAATPFQSIEAENGKLTAPAKAVSDSTASAGQSITFSAPATAGFVHPGVLIGRTQLEFVKAKIAVGQEPWKSELTKAINTKGTNGVAYGSSSYKANPWEYVGCGAYHNPNEGCFDETSDADAAYTKALLWYYTGNAAYAQQSVAIMNAWSAVMKGHKTDGVYTPDSTLQSAWAGSVWPRAAEIIRYTYTPACGQEKLDIPRFSNMLRTAYLPLTIDGWAGPGYNRLTTQAEATMAMGVFLDDKAVFDNAAGDWRDNVKCSIWMAGDMNKWPQLAGAPLVCTGSIYDRSTSKASDLVGSWNNPKSWPSGLEAETCRDFNHMAMGMASMFNAAETAHLQGLDLYAEQQTRLTTSMELVTGYINSYNGGHATPTGWPCSGAANGENGVQHLTWVLAYNQYANRKGIALPNTKYLIQNRILPSNYRSSNHVSNEVLTSYGTP